MILHTVNKSPFSHQTLTDCLRLCNDQSSVLFIEDGVLAGKMNTQYSQLLAQHTRIRFYALKADVLARGLENTLCKAITIIDDAGFVDLVAEHDSIQSWF